MSDEARSPGPLRSVRRFAAIFRRALQLVWAGARHEVLMSWVLDAVVAVALTVQLFLIQRFLADLVGAHPRANHLGDVAPLIAVLAVVHAIGDFVSAASQERQRLIAELTARHVQGRLLDVAARVDLATFETPAFHDHLARANTNALLRPYQVAVGVSQTASGLVGTVAILAVLVKLQPLAALVLVAGCIPLWVAATRNSRSLYEVNVGLAPIDRERTYLGQLLVGKDEAKELRAFQVGGFFLRRWRRLSDERIRQLRQLARARQHRSLIANAGASLFFVAAFAGLLELVFTGRMTLAAAGAAAVAVQLLAGRLQQLMTGISLLYECSLFLDDVNAFIALDPGERVPDRPASGFEHVVFDQVSFAYPNTAQLVLDQVSLELKRGEVVALVGENGSGKSTVVKLLCGLYQPTAGSIHWDGVNAAGLDVEDIRANVATVFQDFLRYQLPARDNIGVGRVERTATTDAVTSAAEAAGADPYLARLAAGYDTVLSRSFEGGTDLSIGQWQRVAVARLLFRDAPFVILDEPTSALDPEAEHNLFEMVHERYSDRAVLIISHRLASVRSAARIYVLDGGRVIEQGCHDELMEAGGRYARMFHLQASAYRTAGGAGSSGGAGSAEA